MNSKISLDYDTLKQFAIDNNIDFLAVYGSFFKGNQTEKSDIDLIIDANRKITNEDLDSLQKKLEIKLNRKIDLITPRLMISSLICGYVWRLKEYEIIYGNPIVLKD